MSESGITVLLVDDHKLVRKGLETILAAHGIDVIGGVPDGESAIKFVKERKPDVVLMDVKMPKMGGVAATVHLFQMEPNLRVLAISSCKEEPFPTRLLQAGAVGYITKDSSPEEIAHAIRTVHAGQKYITPSIAERLAVRHLVKTEKSPFAALSSRELQVMMLITQGMKVLEISLKLGLSPKTVNSYRYRLFEKLGISNDVELTHLAIRHGIEVEALEGGPDEEEIPAAADDGQEE